MVTVYNFFTSAQPINSRKSGEWNRVGLKQEGTHDKSSRQQKIHCVGFALYGVSLLMLFRCKLVTLALVDLSLLSWDLFPSILKQIKLSESPGSGDFYSFNTDVRSRTFQNNELLLRR